MSGPATPRRVEVTVDRPANGGESVGRADGRVVFVRGAIPGERVVADITDDRHDSYWRAEVAEVLDASPHRVAPRCPAAAAGAGCCDLAHVTPDHARDLKQDVLLDVLDRVGRLPGEIVAGTELATDGVRRLGDAEVGWRIRTRLAVDGRGRPGQSAFRGRGVVTEACVQPAPGMLDGLADRGFTTHSELAVVLDADGARHITELAPVAEPRRGRADSRRRAQQNRARHARPRAQRVVEGEATAVQRVGGRSWDIPVAGFWQAHRNAPRTYAETVVDFVGAHLGGPPRVAWDLYGGAGVFAGALLDGPAGAPDTVHIVDSDPAALDAAERAFAGDGDGVHTHRGEVAARITDLTARPDVVVLDPPRTGAGERVIGAIADARPGIVVHVGCDAARFARDLGYFAARGYRVVDIRGFDAFPLTHHVEAVACLIPAADG
ncbi:MULTISPECIES: TRAM domain-containing protein [unclassified Gordonia (in: high G+C Gram-positive bacteria)]|uniref:class I SAM-dependent RNA methyltransferase n=1 Tax=unclassified Gordonia (in: high G+C Gram-positive bacteria) TaxID=2657482 RepID=UPI001964DCFF|nr:MULTISPECIES: TRAM domain-containing protein [unclassified Gordonia (in: high G+C Gram-positive bacteria)]MBN0974088.1 class I SAM-dependent RNA methyltransferase [Gordonia sp. BP-119]MBN0985651.1 class I SAM-dependent RNA methyltransferase [Gordonia sp. BP-94]WGJ87528.1 class I SAM-dependent RNA methyltransferase [Gordonia sp. SMJS1]